MSSLPARLVSEQVALRLGFKKHDVAILTRGGLLKPLGKPSQQCVKYYAAIDIESKATDHKWLSKATDALYDHWRGGGKEEVEP